MCPGDGQAAAGEAGAPPALHLRHEAAQGYVHPTQRHIIRRRACGVGTQGADVPLDQAGKACTGR